MDALETNYTESKKPPSSSASVWMKVLKIVELRILKKVDLEDMA
jgi:hypothetical protein